MSRELIIDGTRIHDDGDCYVVAEIGQNHQGDIEKAKQLFLAARQCGVNAVKLQKRNNRALYTRALYDSPYENENSFGATYGLHREALEFGRAEYEELRRYAAEIGVTMFATAWDFDSADFLEEVGVPAYKIASGDLKTTPLLEHVAKKGQPMLVSTGGGTLEDVRRAYDTIMPLNARLCLLQCTAAYPAEADALNLRVITTFREAFPDVVVGLSDHQNGISMAVVAYVLGARVIEKHFTLQHTWKGTDHAFSLEPIGLQKLVRDVRRVPLALGDGVKRVVPQESRPLRKMAKSIVAARDLAAGHAMTLADLAFKSPADGLPPCDYARIVGRPLRRAVAQDEVLRLDMLGAAP